MKIQFNLPLNGANTSKKDKDVAKLALILSIPPPIPAKFPKEVNAIFKHFKKLSENKEKKLYAQTSAPFSNVAREILKIKEMFPKLQDNKIKHIQNIISGESKIKPYLNMTTKKPSRKQVIIPMNTENRNCFMKDSSAHISNINKVLKNIKSEIVTDFICVDGKGIIITTNKVANTSDLQTIERYIRNVNSIELNQVEALRLPQSKSYLKIIGISYFIKNTNIPISADVVEKIIKENHIFNDIILMLRLRAIKISPKSNMSIIWIDI